MNKTNNKWDYREDFERFLKMTIRLKVERASLAKTWE